MSYLTPPRLVFAGKFQADVSTVNNDPAHFDTANFQPNYNLPRMPEDRNNRGKMDGWWNPKGTGAWRFFNCSVQSVTYSDGTTSVSSDWSPDPVVGLPLNAAGSRVEGKLVDLDPEQQMVSEIWGFQVIVGDPAAGLGIGGDFKVAAFADIWSRFPQGRPDSLFGAIYQSVLHRLKSAHQRHSRFMHELLAHNPERLSIKFNVDGLDDTATSPWFTFGRVVGSIGLHKPGDPQHIVLGRALTAAPGQTFGTAYAKVKDSKLYIDLGNSMPTTGVGASLADQGSLFVAFQDLTSGDLHPVGQIPYSPMAWYESTAGIVSFPLDPTSEKLSQSTAVAIVNQQGVPILTDSAPTVQTGPCQTIRADEYVFRFNPGDSRSGSLDAVFYATEFGEPLANQQVSLGFDSMLMAQFINQGTAVSGPNVGDPPSGISWPSAPIITDSKGKATVTLTSTDPGNPRGYIDGQIYGITYALGARSPALGAVQNPSQILNALVFSTYAIPERPNWLEHVQPIMQQYANLYPIMRPIVDLGSYSSVVARLGVMRRVFSASIDDPNYMPVTRDLSAPKLAMIRKWLHRPLYMDLDSVEDVRTALQLAIELEHSTIPPYLTALYSIKPGTNVEVAELIRSVVMEEMLHMTLAANILTAIGGTPRIGRPGFIPSYPGPLPGGLGGDLTVRLRKCSIEHIRDCFVAIEEPEQTDADALRRVTQHQHVQTPPYTIGWFYDEILAALTTLGSQLTFENLDKQITHRSVLRELFPIGCLEDARKAITIIKQQGEGISWSNPNDGDHELAHFFKFNEIVHGRRLVRRGDTFSYTGAAVPFDPSGVYPMMDDPDLVFYPAGSRAQVLALQFAQTYQALLNSLNEAFSGSPQKLDQAIGLMYSLSLAARQLMETPSGLNDGTTAGPAFQVPVPGLTTVF